MISIRIFWEDELSLKSLPNAKSCYHRNNYKCLNVQRIRQSFIDKNFKNVAKANKENNIKEKRS